MEREKKKNLELHNGNPHKLILQKLRNKRKNFKMKEIQLKL